MSSETGDVYIIFGGDEKADCHLAEAFGMLGSSKL